MICIIVKFECLLNNFLFLKDVDPEIINDFSKINSVYSRPTKIDGFCDLISIPSADTRISLEFRQPNVICSCQIVYLLINELSVQSNNAELSRFNKLPCRLSGDANFISNCMRNLNAYCVQKKDDDNDASNFLKGYVKFWEYCISEVEPMFKTGSNSGIFVKPDTASEGAFNGYLYSNFDGTSLSLSPSSFYDSQLFEGEQDSQFKMSDANSANPNSPSLTQNSNTDVNSNNIIKTVGIVVGCSVISIILLMITVNIIQYKRDDLLDDLEFNVTNSKTKVWCIHNFNGLI